MKKSYSSLLLLSFLLLISNILTAKDYFWIGTNGNWNNPQNWSFSENGKPANSIPNSIDNVIFTSRISANQSITFDQATCKNFIVQGNSKYFFNGNENADLIISGNIQLSPTTTIVNAGKIVIANTKNISVDFNSAIVISTIDFKSSAKVNLSSDLNVLGQINHFSAEIEAQNFDISAESYQFLTPAQKYISFTSANLYVEKEIVAKNKSQFINDEKIILQEGMTSKLSHADIPNKKGGNGNNNKSAVQAFVTVINPTCNGICNGIAYIDSIVGSSPSSGPYVYTWVRAGYPTVVGDTARNLCIGSYLLRVFDVSDGTTIGFFINVQEPNPIFANIIKTDESCFGACDGTATTSPIGGTPYTVGSPYRYIWSNSATTPSISSLCTGTYWVTITDSNGCMNVDTVVVGGPTQIRPNVTTTNVICKGDCNGTATAAPTGGAGGYTYVWSTGPTTPGISGLCPGGYSVIVTDIDGCSEVQTVSITEPAIALSANFSLITNPLCNGSSDGVIAVNPIGGQSPYTYLWSNAQTGDTIKNLAAGTYSVTVTDSNSCSVSISTTLTNPTLLTASITAFTDENCFGAADGTATVSASGGTLPYTYLWSNSQTNSTATGLTAGTYTVTVTDNNNCTAVDQIIISSPPVLTASIINHQDVSCFGLTNGSTQVSASGGTPPYTYNWSNGPTTVVNSGLSGGIYTVTVTDFKNCTTTVSDTILAPQPLNLNATVISNALCNGGNQGSATVAVNGGVMPYTFLWSNAQTNDTASALTAGSYSVTVTDSNGCTNSATITITEPTAVNASIIASSNPSCITATNGTATASGSGGNPPYSYSWSSGGSSATETNLGSGTYFVTVTDANMCSDTASVTLVDPTGITALAVPINNVSCNGGTDGTAAVIAFGGTPPYTYNWSSGGFMSVEMNLSAGFYTVIVSDANNCSASANVTISEPNAITNTFTITNANCNNVSDGMITANPLGGIPPYTYSWSNADTTATIDSLMAGTYILTITDSNSCTFIDTAFVLNGLRVQVQLDSLRNIACFGDSTGFLSVSGLNGTPPYTFLWSNGATSSSISNLKFNTYSVTISDANGCFGDSTFTINQNNQLVANINKVDVLCNGDNNGVAAVTVVGGTPPYSYNWSNAATTAVINGLSAGNYTVTVSDSSSCSVVGTVTINQPNPLIISDSIQPITCFNECDASISITNLSGGTNPYSFNWSTGDTTSSIDSLCAGTYSLTITDFNGCDTTINYTINQPNLLSSNTTKTDVSCGGLADGSVVLNVNGGTLPYSFNWSNSATSQNLSGLSPGKYFVTITDSNGCNKIDSAEIFDGAFVGIQLDSLRNVLCNGDSSGYLSVSGTGGNLPYSFLWSNGDTTNFTDSLIAGIYTVRVSDSSGCFKDTLFTIIETPIINSSFTKSDVSCNGANDGRAVVSASGGIPPYTFAWSNLQTTDTIVGLSGGTYYVTITDSNACSKIDSVQIFEPNPFNFTDSITNDLCFGSCSGSIFISNLSGGTAPYFFNWSNGDTTNFIDSLCAGAYSLTITDFNGCDTTLNYTISEPSILSDTLITTDVSCNGTPDGTITLNVSGGTPPYTFMWSNAATTQNLSGLSSGKYFVTITDSNNCTLIDSAEIFNNGTIGLDVDSIQNISCNGDSNAFISVSAKGGISPYRYIWSNGDTTNLNDSLKAATYTLRIIDSIGCIFDTNFIISEPPLLQLNFTKQDINCSGTNDGSVFVSVSGGVQPYTYAWSNANTTDTIRNLSAGVYSLTVTDSNGCNITDSIRINSTTAFSFSDSIVSNLCFNDCNGFISINNLSGGTPPYTYAWSNGQSDTSISNLCAGNYNVTITDSLGCDTTLMYVITSPAVLSVNTVSTNSNCSVCDGMIVATAFGGSPAYSFEWFDNTFTPIGQTSDTAKALCAGIYNLITTDTNGCRDTTTAIVNDNNGPIISTSTIDVDCFGNMNGKGIVSSTCIDSNLCTVVWFNNLGNPIGQTSDTASGLDAGIYYVQVTDTFGCKSLDTIIINSPSQLVSNITAINLSCDTIAVCDGKVFVSPSGGVPPYTYLWAGSPTGQGTDTISNLCAGMYSVTITDSNGCSISSSINVIQRSSFTVSITATDESCNNSCDGTAIATISGGGKAPFTYVWSPAPPFGQQGNDTLNNLCAGTYNLTVTDSVGCEFITSITIGSKSSIVANPQFTNLSCLGICDGTAAVSPIGGIAPYTYLWSPNPPFGQGTDSVSGLCAGPIRVLITDSSGCDTAIQFNIAPNSPILPNDSITNASCNGACDGSIVVNPNGGIGGLYTYLWNPVPPNGQGTNTANNLCAGTYQLTITDASLCDTTLTFIVGEPSPIVSNIGTIDASCFGSCDGSAFAIPTGGTAPYTYLWSNSATTDTINNLCAGTYSVTITDSNGCNLIDTFRINEKLPFGAITSSTLATCDSCDGTATVTPNGSGPYSYLWLDMNGDTINTTDSTIINRCAGIYLVQLTDTNSKCTESFTVPISNIGGETVAISSSDVSCIGLCDGTATANFNCTTPNCSVEWFDANTALPIGQTTITATNLCEGNYFVQVTNGANCITISGVSINSPTQLTSTISATDMSCANSCDGTAKVRVSGGVGNYTYNWTPTPAGGQGTDSIFNACAGTYIVTISDSNLCSIADTIIIGAPTPITATFNATQADCGLSNGSISVVPSGGKAPYTLQWFDGFNSPIVGQTNTVLSGITAGTYFVRITDSNACNRLYTFNLSNKNGPLIVLDSLFDNKCAGDHSGALFISVSGGTAPYSYNWSPNGSTFQDISGLSAGRYTVEVTDANLCKTFASYTINTPAPLTASFTTSDAACGICDGEAIINMSGGTAPYTYLWSTGSDSLRSVNLCAGLYSVDVTDANGCSKTFNYIINNDGGPTSEILTINPASCFNSCDGSASITPIGGTAPYSYYWPHNGASTNSLNNLCAGTYFVQVTDSNGCMRVSEVLIIAPTAIEVTATITAVSCNTFPCDGSIYLDVRGGQAPYSFNWGPVSLADTNYVTDICAGNYFVDITDANNCTIRYNYSISNTAIPIDPQPTKTDVSCNGNCDGTLTSNVSSTLVDFQWLDINNIAVAAVNTDASGLCAGVYILELTTIPDGCKYYERIEIFENPEITFTLPNISEINCLDDCDGQIKVNANGGTLPYTFIWNDPAAQSGNTAQNLCVGTYTVTVFDANRCSAQQTASIVGPSPIVVSIVDTTNTGCSNDCDGTAEISVSGGKAPYTYAWSNGQTSNTATGLCFGYNYVTITDASNCTFVDSVLIGAKDTVVAIAGADTIVCENTLINLIGTTIGNNVSASWYELPSYTLLTNNRSFSFVKPQGTYQYAFIATNAMGCADTSIKTVTVLANPFIDAGRDIRIYDDEIAQISIIGANNSYNYLWQPGINLNDSTIDNPRSDTRITRTYTLFVTDTNGCMSSDSMRVLYEEPINFPSGFTPNGDGVNDVWNLNFIEDFPNTTVKVFNRWGEILFESVGYKTPWDGKYDNKAVPVGTYYYIIDLKTDRFEPFTGPITIMR